MNEVDAGTPTWLRERNDRAAFRLLLEHGPLSRLRLGQLSGLSKPTAGQMLNRLERVGLIAQVGRVSAGRGPNAVSYGVRTDRITGVAISVLEHAIQSVVVDALNTDHPVATTLTAGAARSPEGDVRAAVAAACSAAGVEVATVSRVVVGVQAAFHPEDDELSFTDTLPGWPTVGSQARIESETGLSVWIDNDVNLAAMAERGSEAASDASSFALLWIGEGLGVGLDLGGVLHRGASGGAGEIGYLAVPRGAAGIDAEASDFTELLGGPALRGLLGASATAPLDEVLAELPDRTDVMERLAERIVLAVDPLVAIVDPGVVILGGPTGAAGGTALAMLVAERIDAAAHPRLAIRATATGPQPVLLGARQILVEQIRDRLEALIAAA